MRVDTCPLATRSLVAIILLASAGCSTSIENPDATQGLAALPGDAAMLTEVCARPIPEAEGVELDAQAYADAFGVTFAEAVRRLRTQFVSGVGEAGAAAAPELWAGQWLEHEPDFGYVLLYKGDPEQTAHVRDAVADCVIPIFVRSGATHSEAELLAGMERLTASGRLDPPMPPLSMHPDLATGHVVLGGPIDPGPDVLAEYEKIAGVPVRYVEEAIAVPG